MAVQNELSWKALIEEVGIKMEYFSIPKRPDEDWSGDKKASHWMLVLQNKAGKAMTVIYSHGSAYRRWKVMASGLPDGQRPGRQVTGSHRPTVWFEQNTEPMPPQINDVLACLANECEVLNYTDFEDWANNIGYDTDSRKAEETYRTCVKQSKELRELFGSHLEQLLELAREY